MIITVTPNPSLDRTAHLDTVLQRGGVHRLVEVTTDPGGKGVNIARVVHQAGYGVTAVVPADPGDPLLVALDALGLAYRQVPIGAPVRTNLTVTEPDGTTTKLNAPGATLSAERAACFTHAVIEAAAGADWVSLSGSLPPGLPVDWYARVVRELRPLGVRLAVDTSDAPLRALAEGLPDAAPDLIKPNSEELGQLAGVDGARLEAASAGGDYSLILAAARRLNSVGVGAVLVTLGGSGAVLVTAEGAWHATAPRVAVRSTVGAGDSALAGYLLADLDGCDAPTRLRRAVAYGSAAASLPGTTLPTPDQVRDDVPDVTRL
jgi:1-phosphofructokinase